MATAKFTKKTTNTSTKAKKTKQTTKKSTTKATTTKKSSLNKNDKIIIKGKKVLFVTSESSPFIRTGGLGDVAGALPKALAKLGYDVRVILPLYGAIDEKYKSIMRYIDNTSVPLGWRYQYAGLFEQTTSDGIKYYFIDNEYYFKRDGLYGHYDDGERFAFFSKAVLEVLKLIDFYPDVIHCNDWHSALVPVFLDEFYRDDENYKYIKTVFTIHNIKFQGKYDKYMIKDVLGISDDRQSIVEYGDCLNFMKGAIETANVVTTVSKTYADEILDSYYAYGLESILEKRKYKLVGITNGIDTTVFNPARDKSLFKKYSVKTLDNKEENKKGLCEMLRMQYDSKKPLISMITRLTSQKGVDLISAVIEDILKADVQFVVLGTGDWKYENMFKELEHQYGAKFKAIINFNDDLASKIYGASDIFLMPSKFEPCGLGQLIAMRYGTIPLVRETGGLKDTVMPFNIETKKGTGFTFKTYNAHDMLNSLWSALDIFSNRKVDWKTLIKNAMSKDYSWTNSAKLYDKLYKKL